MWTMNVSQAIYDYLIYIWYSFNSLLELAHGWGSIVDPNVNSKMGIETRMRGEGWQHGGGGDGIKYLEQITR